MKRPRSAAGLFLFALIPVCLLGPLWHFKSSSEAEPSAVAGDWSFRRIRWSNATNDLTIVSSVHEIGFPRDLFAIWKNDRGSFLFRVRCLEDGVQPCIVLLQQDKLKDGIGQLYMDERAGFCEVSVAVGLDSDSPSGLRCVYWSWENALTDETLRDLSGNKDSNCPDIGYGNTLAGMDSCDFGDDSFLFASVRGHPASPFAISRELGNLKIEVSTWEDPVRLLSVEAPLSIITAKENDLLVSVDAKEKDIIEELESFPMPDATLRNVPVFEILDLLKHGIRSDRIQFGEPRLFQSDNMFELILPVRAGSQSELDLPALLACSGCESLVNDEHHSPRVTLYTRETNALEFLRMVAEASGGVLTIEDGGIHFDFHGNEKTRIVP